MRFVRGRDHTSPGCHAILAHILRLLFLPVSGHRGSGEFARALAIASEAKRRFPQAEIHFVLSREAPYTANVPFAKTVLPYSATFHPKEVAQLMREFRPDLAIFDNAGRTSQLRAARAVGAKIVFVSSRERQRRRAFRIRWMRLIDEHWIAWPERVAGPLTRFERLKLAMLGRPRVRYFDTLLPRDEDVPVAETLARYGVRPDEFVLLVPGGGTAHARMRVALRIIVRVAKHIADHGHPTLLVGIPADPYAEPLPSALRVLPALPFTELVALISSAKLVLVNGGDTLLQVLACRRASIAVPLAPDQVRRLKRVARAGLHVAVPLDADEIARRAMHLLDDEAARQRLIDMTTRLGVTNATASIQEALVKLLT
jgi:ADP-heptose:LPS heptosyltransferase